MKQFLPLLLSLAIADTCVAQFSRNVIVKATANFNVVLGGLAANDAGIGFGLDASLFSKRRLHLAFEASGDLFIGDKLLIVDSVGDKATKKARVYSLRLGPGYFITKHIAVSATYGPAWHVVRDFDYTLDHSFRLAVSTFWGKKRHLITKLFLVDVARKEQDILYLGVAAGFRF